MTLKQQMKRRLNEIVKLNALPADGAEARELLRQLFAEFTAPSAADIMGAKRGSPLYGEGRRRKLWATLGYAFIVLFLASVAALVVGYWLVSDQRVPWLGKGALLILLAVIAAQILAMLLCANRVTALQNRYTERCIEEIRREYAALSEGDRKLFPRLLRQDTPRRNSGQTAGCLACGALFPAEEIETPDDSDRRCPRCGRQDQLVFCGGDAPLDGDTLNRLRSFMEA